MRRWMSFLVHHPGGPQRIEAENAQVSAIAAEPLKTCLSLIGA